MSDIDQSLARAQALLWSGSLHEVDEAHNIITKLIKDRMKETGFDPGAE